MAKTGFRLSLQDLAEIGQKYLCNSCTFVLRDPVQTECGHHYCRSCLDFLLRKSSDAKCLKDGNPLRKTLVFPDACIAREVLSFTVHCVYVEDGCTWTGEIRVLERHLEECPFVRVSCMFSSCGVLVKRSELAFHLENECSERAVTCNYCKMSIPFSKVKVHESTKCMSFPETCGLCMKTNIPREELKYHHDECEEVERECAFAPVGCKEKKMKKSERENHLRSFVMFHLNLLLVFVLAIRDQIQWVLNKMSNLCEELGNLKALKETVIEMTSQIAALIISNTEVRDELKLQGARTKAIEDNIKEQIGGEVPGGEVLRQRHRDRNEIPEDYEGLRREFTRMSQSLEVLQTAFRQMERELQSQNQIIAMSGVNMTDMEKDLRRLEDTSYKGVLLWKISDFAKKRRDAINGSNPSFYSPFFYSSRYGYKMCARIYLNGDGIGRGTHISLFFVIVRGENDALLRWPFTQKVTMMILDHNSMEHVIDAFKPDPLSSSFQKPARDMNVASGCPMFCPLGELDRHAYVKDDYWSHCLVVTQVNMGEYCQ
ncbi:TNF receptor-associated factor 2-like isoform X3 [Actinia tenebrosa]|uniref:TNF receptor-associated factor 2-like isoform X3 n=1 Tax=Actinia tenebrosa TaxID=6105 RepID=A0A6P8I0J1_ACTTE|nr:TNF receptor-associated factor 2-like isoform X3 [Actinia tenebrosa]